MAVVKPLIRILTAAGLAVAALAATAQAAEFTIVGLGDSLMAGYRLPADDAFPARLEEALRERGHDVAVVNAGVSGDTSAGGLERLEWSVPEGTGLVIVELGANDALRGLPPEVTGKNLDAIIARLRERDIAVLLAGMLAPPNMGRDYENAFNAIYPRLAEKHSVPLYPFFLDGVAANRDFQLDDGMHPNADGVARIVKGILPLVEKSLQRAGG